MPFDIGKTLLRKAEYEYAGAPQVELARRVCAVKALAADLGLHPTPLVDRMAEHGLGAALALAGEQVGLDDDEVERRYRRCRAGLDGDLPAAGRA